MGLKKLKKKTGASITAALLLFLICAVIGAVVLAAGTAASGRLSRMAEMDRRYYRVASAAEFLATELSGKTVTIVRTETNTTVTTTEYVGGISAEPSVVSNTEYNTRANSTSINGILVDISGDMPNSLSIITECAGRLMFADDRCNTPEAMGYTFSRGSMAPRSFSLQLRSDDLEDEELSGLEVSGSLRMDTNGTIEITVWENAEAGDRYELTVTLKPSFTDHTDYSTTEDVETTPTAGGYTKTVTSVRTVTKTSTATWSVAGIG